MKLIIEKLNYEYGVSRYGIYKIQKDFQDPEDAELYDAIYQTIKTDFQTAPIDISSSNIIYQKISYVINNNPHYSFLFSGDTKINKNVEAMSFDDAMKIINLSKVDKPQSTDLQ